MRTYKNEITIRIHYQKAFPYSGVGCNLHIFVLMSAYLVTKKLLNSELENTHVPYLKLEKNI